MGVDDNELPLFHLPPCAHYYVQSPSAASHTLSHPASDSMALILFPFPTLHHDVDAHREHDHDHEDPTAPSWSAARRSLAGHHNDGDDDDADGDEAAQRSGAWRYVKLDPEAPCCCIAFQVAASAAFALLVFVLATRPRHPQVSFSVGKVQRFALGEGLDGSGVETSFLNCNSSVDMVIDNYSKVFTLRVGPPQLQMSFGRFVLAIS
ncbi:hypothetical protein U9M48_001179 [Paspalum notatum var. saurae]|uniref:Uncharacterized protein n=1 Tax=Paspalum notatum var. saurae TaxID=547442 RepID=A0AAQ3PHW8_PASNO